MSITRDGTRTFDGNFRVATQHGPRRLFYPFEASNDAVFEVDLLVNIDDYEPMAFDTEHDEHKGFYLVKEVPPEPIGGGIGRIVRTFAQIPSPRREMETYAYTVPGIDNSGVLVALKTITGGVVSGTSHVLTTSTSHGLTTGDACIVNYTTTDVLNGWAFTYSRSVFREVLSAPSSTQVEVALITDIGPITWISICENYSAREPYTRVVPSYLHFDYWLPGVSAGISSFDDIPVLQPVRILDTAGNETESYSDSPATRPTATEYRAQVARGEWIVAEPSNIRRWMGNIYERATRHIRAV